MPTTIVIKESTSHAACPTQQVETCDLSIGWKAFVISAQQNILYIQKKSGCGKACLAGRKEATPGAPWRPCTPPSACDEVACLCNHCLVHACLD